MRLKYGITAQHAAAELHRVLSGLEAVRHGADLGILEYSRWVITSEKTLRAVFIEPDLALGLYSSRFWYLFSAPVIPQEPGHSRFPEMLYAEIESRLQLLRQTAEELKSLRHLGERPGRIVVYDTNSLLHYQPPQNIVWEQVVGRGETRLIVPQVVIDELDTKKYTGSGSVPDRARASLRDLQKILQVAGPGDAVPVPDRDGVTLEVFLDEPSHRRLDAADDEIIDRAGFLNQLSGRSVSILTHDTGMTLRAQVAGLVAKELPPGSSKNQKNINP